MAYRIEYKALGPVKPAFFKKYGMLIIVVFLLVSTVSVSVAYLSGAQWARHLLFPGDPEVTAGALEGMADKLKQGSSVVDAITAFCRAVIAGGV